MTLRLTILITLITLMGCHSSKNSESESKASTESKTSSDGVYRIHDIWILTVINDRKLSKMDVPPRLEVFAKDMRYLGSDGCNNYNGTLKSLTKETIEFGIAASTKKMCPRTDRLSREYYDMLAQVKSYDIVKLHLILKDASGNPIAKLFKID